MSMEAKYFEKIHNVETGETIMREFSPEETAEIEANKKRIAEELATKEAEAASKIAAKNLLLEKLGITEDEAKLLLQ